MGGLGKKMKVTYWTFLLSTIAIAGVPLFSAFFSKDEILWWAFGSTRGSWLLWLVGAIAAGMTAFYMFRCVSMTFWGEQRTDARVKDHIHESPWVITLPLVILALLAVVGGYVGVPHALGNLVGHFPNYLENFLHPVFGHAQETYHIAVKEQLAHSLPLEFGLMGLSVAIAFFGIGVAIYMYLKRPELPGKFTAKFPKLHDLVYNKWYIDELYDALFVNPCKAFGRFCWRGFDVNVVDGIVNGFGYVAKGISSGLRFTQSGLTQNYAAGMVVGVVILVGYFVLR